MTIKHEIAGPAVQEYARTVAAADAAGRAIVNEWYKEQVDPNWFDNQLAAMGVSA